MAAAAIVILALLFFRHLAKFGQFNKPKIKAPRGSRFVLILIIIILLLAVTHGRGGHK